MSLPLRPPSLPCRPLHCTMDLSAFGPGLHATARLLHLRDYDPAFVVVYKVRTCMGKSGSIHLTYKVMTCVRTCW